MDYEIAGLVLLAAVIATLVRIEDWPPSDWSEVKNVLGTFFGTAVVTVFAAWYMAEAHGVLIDSVEGMLTIVVMGAGGVATIRAILNQATKVLTSDEEEEEEEEE